MQICNGNTARRPSALPANCLFFILSQSDGSAGSLPRTPLSQHSQRRQRNHTVAAPQLVSLLCVFRPDADNTSGCSPERKPGAPRRRIPQLEQSFNSFILASAGLKHSWNNIKPSQEFTSVGAVCALQADVFISGVWTSGAGKKIEDWIFMSHRGLYGEVNPGVWCGGGCVCCCQVRVEMSSYQPQHMYNDLFIRRRTLGALSRLGLYLNPALCLSPGAHTSIKRTRTTNYSVSALSSAEPRGGRGV